MKDTQKTFEAHRFGELVAFHLDNTETLYITSDMARRIGLVLARFADDIDKTGFCESTLESSRINE